MLEREFLRNCVEYKIILMSAGGEICFKREDRTTPAATASICEAEREAAIYQNLGGLLIENGFDVMIVRNDCPSVREFKDKVREEVVLFCR